MTDGSDYAGRFLNAAESIKSALGRKYGRDFDGLGQACRHAADKNDPVVRRHKEALKTFADLRNVMQHSPVLNGKVLATPREDAVLAIENIAQWVENPPQIRIHMIKNPNVVNPTGPLVDAATLVISEGFSQLPVYADNRYVALFTTNALARWLSAAVQRGEGDIIEGNVKISDVLAFTEDHEEPKFVKPTESAYKVCEILSSDDPLPAVLITTDGLPSGQLQGIVTRFDVPTILRKITTTFP